MENSNNCIIIINKGFKNEISNLSVHINQGLLKLSQILSSIPAALASFTNGLKSEYEDVSQFIDEENHIAIQLLIQPHYKQLKDALNHLSQCKTAKEKYVIYMGSHGGGYCSDWLLSDGIMSPNTMATIFVPPDASSDSNLTENTHSPLNIITPGNSAYWNTVLSRLKGKDSNQDSIRVFTFTSEMEDGNQAGHEEINAFTNVVCDNLLSKIVTDCNSSETASQEISQLINKNGSLYVFDEGCGQSSLLTLNGFNLLIDAGYSYCPKSWKALRTLDRIDTCLVTNWNHSNIFGIQNLLEQKSNEIGPSLNYCIVPTGPNINKPLPDMKLKSSLNIHLENEVVHICKQLQDLDIPVAQICRDDKSIKAPNQLYFKLGHGCLEAFQLCPRSAESSTEFKKYLDEWNKSIKGQSVHFDEMMKDNATACLLLWSRSKINEHNSSDENLMRILISSSCHENMIIKSLEEFSKSFTVCNTRSGKPMDKKVDDKKPKLVPATNKVLGNSEPNENHFLVHKNKVLGEPLKPKKISDGKKSPLVVDGKANSLSKAEPIAKIKDTKLIPPKEPLKVDKKPPSKEPLNVEKKQQVAHASTKAKEVAKLDKKLLVIDKPMKSKEMIKPEKKLVTTDKVVPNKKIEKAQPNVPTSAPVKLRAETALKPETAEATQSLKMTSNKSSESSAQKKIPKVPARNGNAKKLLVDITVKNAANKKPSGIKSEGDKAPMKSGAVSKGTKKPVQSATVENKPKMSVKVPVDVTVNKIEIESDQEKIEAACHQPSISLNTDDTLNNIDTSELLGKLEKIGPITDRGVDKQLMVASEVRDLHSTPLSDMITDSPEHPKTEEDVEPLKTDGVSIDLDLLNANEDLSEDDLDDRFKAEDFGKSDDVEDLKQYGIYDDEEEQEADDIKNSLDNENHLNLDSGYPSLKDVTEADIDKECHTNFEMEYHKHNEEHEYICHDEAIQRESINIGEISEEHVPPSNVSEDVEKNEIGTVNNQHSDNLMERGHGHELLSDNEQIAEKCDAKCSDDEFIIDVVGEICDIHSIENVLKMQFDNSIDKENDEDAFCLKTQELQRFEDTLEKEEIDDTHAHEEEDDVSKDDDDIDTKELQRFEDTLEKEEIADTHSHEEEDDVSKNDDDIDTKELHRFEETLEKEENDDTHFHEEKDDVSKDDDDIGTKELHRFEDILDKEEIDDTHFHEEEDDVSKDDDDIGTKELQIFEDTLEKEEIDDTHSHEEEDDVEKEEFDVRHSHDADDLISKEYKDTETKEIHKYDDYLDKYECGQGDEKDVVEVQNECYSKEEFDKCEFPNADRFRKVELQSDYADQDERENFEEQFNGNNVLKDYKCVTGEDENDVDNDSQEEEVDDLDNNQDDYHHDPQEGNSNKNEYRNSDEKDVAKADYFAEVLENKDLDNYYHHNQDGDANEIEFDEHNVGVTPDDDNVEMTHGIDKGIEGDSPCLNDDSRNADNDSILKHLDESDSEDNSESQDTEIIREKEFVLSAMGNEGSHDCPRDFPLDDDNKCGPADKFHSESPNIAEIHQNDNIDNFHKPKQQNDDGFSIRNDGDWRTGGARPDNIDEHKPDIIPFDDDIDDFTSPGYGDGSRFDMPGKSCRSDTHPLYYSPDLNSASPADSDLSADIVKDHSAMDVSIEGSEHGHLKSMTPLDELSEDGNSLAAKSNAPSVADEEEDTHTVADLETDNHNLSIITPDIIKGLKRANLCDQGEVTSQRAAIDEELFKYHPTNVACSVLDEMGPSEMKRSDLVDTTDYSPTMPLMEDNQSNISERGSSIESASSILAQKSTDNELDLTKNVTMPKIDAENVSNGDRHDDSNSDVMDPLSQWNAPLGLPKPTMPASNKPAAKSAEQPSADRNRPSSSTAKPKTTPPKLNGTLTNSGKLTQKSSESPKSAPIIRTSVTPKSATKTSEVQKSTVSTHSNKSETNDHSKSSAFYLDVAFIPVDNDGNVSGTRVTEHFFTRVRARHYILPGLEHDPAVLDSLLCARKKWCHWSTTDDHELTLVPVSQTQTLTDWSRRHAQELTQYNINISPVPELQPPSTVTLVHRIDF